MIKRVLVANRGEIAIRIIKSAKQLGVKTVLICSSEDRNSMPTEFADSVICIGPPPAAKSYLHQESIIQTALSFGCDAIHPGYGFLSENEEFARKCKDHGIIFIGPEADTIRLMGDKMSARRIMMDNEVPIVPGSRGCIKDVDEAKGIAEEIGYPIIIKASAGGGGRGMRIAHDGEEIEHAFYEAKKEALVAFGNDDLYLEKLVENTRHIEVQILADNYGNIVHLGTRDCSLQRRHQKMVEEAPAYMLSDKINKDICNAAVRAAQAIGYKNAGTVEFVLDKDNHYFFIEVNTRIQVEHPVTEMITGVDLIEKQFLIASGEEIGLKQEDIVFNGASIECRINAEDPENGFRPSPGLVKKAVFPNGAGIRVDTYIQAGANVSPWYDSMIAKIIVHASDRKSAIIRMQKALDNTRMEGIKTNLSFLSNIMDNDKYQRGEVDTDYLEQITKGRENS